MMLSEDEMMEQTRESLAVTVKISHEEVDRVVLAELSGRYHALLHRGKGSGNVNDSMIAAMEKVFGCWLSPNELSQLKETLINKQRP